MKQLKNIFITVFFILLNLFCLAGDVKNETVLKKEKAEELLSNQTAVFRKNAGQFPDDILYRTSSSNANIYFMKNSLSFGFRRDARKHTTKAEQRAAMNFSQSEATETLVWNLHFIDANKNTTIAATNETNSYTNYILGNDPAKWKSNVPDFGEIKYVNIYNNIDLNYYGTGKALKYDYILHPGGNAASIKMQCEGIKKLTVNKEGELEITTDWGTQLERAPYAYQEINGEKKKVDVHFHLITKTTFGFEVSGKYDKEKDLIIDPVILEWSTFIGGGGAGNGYIFDIAVDAAGDTYATGYYNQNFPVTAGAYDTSYNQGGSCGFGGSFEDVYVIKINPSATGIIYATYVGGSCAERGRGITINAAGEAFVTGWSKSTDFPMVSAFQGVNNGSVDVVAFRLNASGSALIYSTYLGGTYNDWAEKVAIDAANNAYLVGSTLDNAGINTYPVTAGSFQSAYGGGMWQGDAYLTKLNAAGGMVYSSFLGGTGWDWAYSVKVNAAGEAFITGKGQTNFPTTAGAYQMVNAGADDAFVTRINAAGTSIIYSTFVGGSAVTNGSCACETGNYIVINSADEAFVTGNVRSSNFPTTAGAYQTVYGGGYYGDAFVFKLNSTGSALLFSTYLGGSTLDIGWGMDVSSTGELFIAGYTDAVDYPTTTCAYDRTYNGSTDGDFFVAKLNSTATMLMYSTYIGGNDQDYWEPKIKLLGTTCDQRAVFSGTSHSINFPTTPGVIQPVKLNGVNDQPVILKLKPKIFPGFTATPSALPCSGNSVTFVDTTSPCGNWGNPFTIHNWDFGDGTAMASGVTVTHIYAPGTYTIKLIVGCPVDSAFQTITISSGTLPVTSPITGTTPVCPGAAGIIYSVTNTPGSTYAWTVPAGATIVSGAGTNSITVNFGATGGTITVTETNSCGTGTPVSFVVTTSTIPITSPITGTTPVCPGAAGIVYSASNTPGSTYSWTVPAGATIVSGAGTNSITVNFGATGGTITVTETNSCGTGAPVSFTVTTSSIPVTSPITGTTPVCPGAAGIVYSVSNTPGSTYAWTVPAGATIVSGAGTNSITVNFGATGGTITVTETSTCGTGAPVSFTVTTSTLIITVSPPSATVCLGGSVALAATGGGTYSWSPSAGLSSSSGSSVTASPAISTTYTVTGTSGSCTGTATVTVTVSNIAVSISPSGGNICAGASLPLSASGATSYSWSPAAGLSTSTGAAVTATPAGTITYTVTGTAAGCTDTATVTIVVTPLTNANAGANDTICSGDSTTLSASGGNSYSWFPVTGLSNPNISNPVASPAVTTLYVVTVSNGGLCSSLDSVLVVVNPSPTANAGMDVTVTEGQSTVLHGIIPAGATCFWTPASGLSCATCATTIASPLTTATYTLTVTRNGCTTTDAVTVFVDILCGELFVPQAFSPNNDGHNDILFVYGDCIKDLEFAVYDRWGENVFSTNDQTAGWDGKYNGKDLDAGVFVWYIKAIIKGQEVLQHGNVTLVK